MVFNRTTYISSHTCRRPLWRERPAKDIRLCGFIIHSFSYRTSKRAQTPPYRSGGAPRLLAVSQPEAPMQIPLPGTIREVKVIQDLQNQTRHLRVTALNSKEATVEAVLRNMQDCNWIHLACHGIQDPTKPTNSAFLINGRLTLNEIMKQSFSHTELAVLSACQTAKGDSELPEEAIHLAAGMLMAGYGSVVGTMWSIRDDDAPIIAEKFYSYLIGEAGGDSTKQHMHCTRQWATFEIQEMGVVLIVGCHSYTLVSAHGRARPRLANQKEMITGQLKQRCWSAPRVASSRTRSEGRSCGRVSILVSLGGMQAFRCRLCRVDEPKRVFTLYSRALVRPN
jgi:hypothetical protein